MAKKKEEEMIRVHNQGKRTIDYYPDPDAKKKKPKYILPNRAVEMKESVAKKYLKSYPHDLIEFDSLISGEKKNISKENARLESENASYLEKIENLESENKTLKENADPEVQTLKDRITELQKDLEEATKPDETDSETSEDGQDKETNDQEKAGQDNKE